MADGHAPISDIPDPPPLRLSRAERIGTAGSCFAQHISRELRGNGFNFVDVEPAPPLLPAELHQRFGYGMFSARYGNVYTSGQLWQLIRRAFARFSPVEEPWQHEGRWFDPFRPSIEPEGFASREELEASRASHLRQVRTLFQSIDVFVFTLGLTESWQSVADGAVFPMCPGTVAGTFDPARYVFANAGYPEVLDAMSRVINFLRRINPSLRFILTVSPVPLTATASGHHVLVATAQSKAVLRAVAGELARRHEFVDYFPSYEIVTSPANQGRFFEENLRSVRPEGVKTVMSTFFATLCRPASDDVAPVQDDASAEFDPMDEDVLCDEARLDARA